MLLTILFFSFFSVYADPYIFKSGDTLSDIVSRYTVPPPPLYGENGRIKRVLEYNPHIKNQDKIKIGEIIYLNYHKKKNKMVKDTTSLVKKEDAVEKYSAFQVINSSDDSLLMNYSFGSFLSLLRIDAKENGQEASVLSKLSYGIDLGLTVKLSSNWELSTDVQYSKYSFNITKGNTLLGAESSTYRIESTLWNSLSKLSVGASLSASGDLVLLSVASSVLILEPLMSKGVGIKGNYKLYKFRSIELVPYFYADYLFSVTGNSFEADSSLALRTGLNIWYYKKEKSYRLKFFYNYKPLSYRSFSQTSKGIGAGFYFSNAF